MYKLAPSRGPGYRSKADGKRAAARTTLIASVVSLILLIAGCGVASPAASGNGTPTAASAVQRADTPVVSSGAEPLIPRDPAQATALPVPNLADDPPCEQPNCWRGITPGETTLAEAARIFPHPENDAAHGTGEARWGSASIRIGKRTLDLYRARVLFENDIVSYIAVVDPESTVTLGDIATKYGPPDFVYLGVWHVEETYWNALIEYPALGIDFATRYGDQMSWPEPSAGMSKRDVVVFRDYFVPTDRPLAIGEFPSPSAQPFPMRKTPWKDFPD
jgi:hypothetical protein